MIVSVLVLASFAVVILALLQQAQRAEEHRISQFLRARLEREVQRELLRSNRPGPGQVMGPPGAARVRRALDNILARSFDQMMALEKKRSALRQLLRHRQSAAQRRHVHQQLRQLAKELRVSELWILMVEERRLIARRLEAAEGGDSRGDPTPHDRPGTLPSQSSVPRLPDWISVPQPRGTESPTKD